MRSCLTASGARIAKRGLRCVRPLPRPCRIPSCAPCRLRGRDATGGLTNSARPKGLPVKSSWVVNASPLMIQEHDRVGLTTPVPSEGLEAGDVGAVVHIHPGGVGYEVEFVTLTGETGAVVTLLASQVRPIARRDLTSDPNPQRGTGGSGLEGERRVRAPGLQ